MRTILWKTIQELCNKFSNVPTLWPSNSTSGYNTLKKLLTYVHQMTCEKVFTRSLRITARNWKQPKWPSTVECINCPMYIKWAKYHVIITHCWWGCKMVQELWGKTVAVLKKFKHKVIIWPWFTLGILQENQNIHSIQ